MTAFKPGDLARCINEKPWFCAHAPMPHAQPGPKLGEIVRVVEGGPFIKVERHNFRYDEKGFVKLAGEPETVEAVRELEVA